MKNLRLTAQSDAKPVPVAGQNGSTADSQADRRLFVSVVVPAFNEASVLKGNLTALCEHLEGLEEEYRWELVLINDGSTDNTGELADAVAKTRHNVRVVHHATNFGMGQAFQSAFNQCRGDYIVVLDVDLSYSPDHVRLLLKKIAETKAKIVIASPYMKGGKVSNVPWMRHVLSISANRFLSLAVRGTLSTLTGMVRAYDARFLRSLDLKSPGMEINPEIIYKASLLHARIEEVPAHLDWQRLGSPDEKRRSSMKVLQHTASIILSGFLFRPVILFLVPGLGLLGFSLYVMVWMLIHFVEKYQQLSTYQWFVDRASAAVGAAYDQFPHTFLIGFATLILAVQLISLGVISFQNKRYFEEIFHLGTTIYKKAQDDKGGNG